MAKKTVLTVILTVKRFINTWAGGEMDPNGFMLHRSAEETSS